MDIQGRIRELMEERSWTEYRLAKEANLSHSTVANMFNRNNAPTFPTLEAICNAFQMTLSQFFCEDGNLIECKYVIIRICQQLYFSDTLFS